MKTWASSDDIQLSVGNCFEFSDRESLRIFRSLFCDSCTHEKKRWQLIGQDAEAIQLRLRQVRTRKTGLFKTIELQYVDSQSPVLNRNYLRRRLPTYNKFMPKADWSYRIISLQQHLRMDENGVSCTISIDWATLAPSENTNGCLGEEREAIGGEDVIIENKHETAVSKER